MPCYTHKMAIVSYSHRYRDVTSPDAYCRTQSQVIATGHATPASVEVGGVVRRTKLGLSVAVVVSGPSTMNSAATTPTPSARSATDVVDQLSAVVVDGRHRHSWSSSCGGTSTSVGVVASTPVVVGDLRETGE